MLVNQGKDRAAMEEQLAWYFYSLLKIQIYTLVPVHCSVSIPNIQGAGGGFQKRVAWSLTRRSSGQAESAGLTFLIPDANFDHAQLVMMMRQCKSWKYFVRPPVGYKHILWRMPKSKEYTRLLMKNDHTGHSALERSLTTRMTSMKDLRLVPIPSNSQSPRHPHGVKEWYPSTTTSILKTCRWPSWPVTSLEALPWCPGQPRAPHWPPTGWFGNIKIFLLKSQISLETVAGEREGDGGHLDGRNQHGQLLLQAHPWYCRKFTSAGVYIYHIWRSIHIS